MAITKKDLEKMDPTSAAVTLLLERFIAEEDKKKNADRFKNIEAEVDWSGTRIILPDDPTRMTYGEAREWLQRLEKAANEQISVMEIIDAFPFDGAIAMMKAMKQIYGWAQPTPPKSFWEAPPTMMSVEISPTERISIIWGRFAIPGLSGTLMTNVHMKADRPVFCISGEVLRKHVPAVAELAELTRKIVKEESIYRSKAIRLAIDKNGSLDFKNPPTFVDTTQVKREELIFTDDLMDQIDTNLFTPITHTAACRREKVPLKRTVLMEGPFGTGKTLCAYVTAQLAQGNGWTFIMIDRVTALKAALQFGVMYQPCMIFCEDIDRETAGERTPELDDLLNVIDGIASKGKEIMVALTSNDAEKINRAMMRPGRIDAVLSIQPPDEAAAEKLMRLYGRGLIPADEPLTKAALELKGQIPATIRECVERAKLYAIARSNGEDKIDLRDVDLQRAASGMKHHLELLHGKQPVVESDEHRLGTALMTLVRKSIGIAALPSDSLYAVAARTEQMVDEIKAAVT